MTQQNLPYRVLGIVSQFEQQPVPQQELVRKVFFDPDVETFTRRELTGALVTLSLDGLLKHEDGGYAVTEDGQSYLTALNSNT